MNNESKIFVRNRTLGYVSNGVPLVTRYIKRRNENLVVTCVDKFFYTWGCKRFTLLSVSKQHDDDILCLAADTFLIFTATSGTAVQAWRRGVELKHTYRNTSGKPVHLLLPFGPHLIGVDTVNVLTVWDIKAADIYLELNFSADAFKITAICHPQCYINKILLGSEQGELQLWNINAGKLIYAFGSGWSSPVTALQESPALDVVAVGLRDGRIILHNVKLDETLITFAQDWGAVVSLAFRTDGPPVLASGTECGHIVFWHLEQRKVISQLLSAHDGSAVTGLRFLPSEPLLVTSSADNSLKQWIFDMPDGGARLLRIREGHSAPPAYIRFYGGDGGGGGNHILSAGADGHLRAFNTVVEMANKNLGRALYRRGESKSKSRRDLAASAALPAITKFAAEKAREKEWDNIAALHNGSCVVTTWSFDKCKLGGHLFNGKFRGGARKTPKRAATSLCLTHCGHFALVGYSTGDLDQFNVQSGILRGSYGGSGSGARRAHEGAVTGVAVNNLNRLVVTGGRDSVVRFWPFKKFGADRLSAIGVSDAVAFFHSHAESSVLAVALDNFEVNVVDTDSRTLIRKFPAAHKGQLADMALSPDARWLVTASMDSTLKTWDLPSGKCIDSFAVDKPCVSVAFCPSGGYLATAHVDTLGVALWSNRCVFSFVSLGSAIPSIVTLDDDDDSMDETTTTTDVVVVNQHSQTTVVHRGDLVTLARTDECPIAGRWQSILNIDVIRRRNQAKEPPKVRPEAPFILPVIPSVNVEFDLSAAGSSSSSSSSSDKKGSKPEKDSRFLETKLQSFTFFTKVLHKCAQTDEYQPAIEKIKLLSPSVVNFEILSLSPQNGGSVQIMLQFLDMLKVMLRSKVHFELSSSYLALFLKVHSALIIDESRLSGKLEEIRAIHAKVWSSLENKLLYNICISKFLRDL